MIETGNGAVGMVAYSGELHHMKGRIKGYRAALRDNGIKLRQKWIQEIHFSKIDEQIPEAIDGLLSGADPVKAILFATNTLAIHGLRHIKESGIKVPDDLSVIGFDESEAFEFFYCPVTYIKQPLAEMGKQAVNLLIDQISDPHRKPKQVRLDARLVIRESCRKSSEPESTQRE